MRTKTTIKMGLFNLFKKNKADLKYTEKVDLIGVYAINPHNEVKLVELMIKENRNDFDAGKITQKIKNTDEHSWQTAYDEKYLNSVGTKIISDDVEKSKNLTEFRIVFFFHYLDLNQPLISQYGLIKLKEYKHLPKRLSDIIKYKPVD